MKDLNQRLVSREGLQSVEIINLTRVGLRGEVALFLMARYQLTAAELCSVLGTSQRGIKSDEILNSVESDRLLRFVTLMRFAESLFDGAARSAKWLHAANRALEGVTPVTLLDSDAGIRAVETVLGRIQHGVYS